MQVLHQIFIICILLYFITFAYCGYETISDSPIQIISIKSPTDAQILPFRNARKTNKRNKNKHKQRSNGGKSSSTIPNGIGSNGDGSSKIITLIKKQPIPLYRTPYMMGNQRGARLQIASGAYPVYYSLAKANGKFNGKTIRSFKSNEI